MPNTLPEKVRKQYVVDQAEKAVDTEMRRVRFVITTGSVDRDNDTVDPSGWDVSNYLRNPVILWAHDYSQPPVARAVELMATGKGLESVAQFPAKGVYPFADTIFELFAGGFLNATSVGFRPLEYTRDEERGGLNFKRQELLEYSVVPVPANAEALAVARSKGIDVSPVEAWIEKQTVDAVLKALPAAIAGNEHGLRETVLRIAGGRVTETVKVGDLEHTTTTELPAKSMCPNCGAEYDGMEPVCDACRPKGVAGKLVVDVVAKVSAVADDEDDPLRWNRQLSKAFDVAGEPADPSRTELAWVSRYLECKVQDISEHTFLIPSARMGSTLSALDECLTEWKQDALRRLTESGREAPPVFETIQLSSRKRGNFLVEGTRFLSRADGVKMVQKYEPSWHGLYVTSFVQSDRTEVRDQLLQRMHARAAELNFLKGEAFTLSGEFLDRGNLDWPDLFLEPKKEAVLRRAVDRINEHGEDMESRGLMMMGPPGTGKTLSGRVMMRQADTTFIWVSARDFFRAGAYGAFDYAFEIAAECAPTILFFEDVDNWLGPEHIDLLKTQMDGLKRRKGLLTVLTTNFPELIPEALIDRPGRFHDLLEVALPAEEVRGRMLDAWIPEAPDEARAATARDTDGFSGAHLKELVHFAKTLEREEKAPLGDALVRALEKIREQRELVASLHAGRSDYRPRRAVRAVVAQAKAAKRGRVLSGANESRLRTARGELDQVLLQLETEPEVDAEEARELAIVLAEEAAADAAEQAIVLRVMPEDEQLATGEDVREAVRGTVRATLVSLVREQTEVALRLARGRVD